MIMAWPMPAALEGNRAQRLDRTEVGSAPIAATPKGSARTLKQTFLGARPVHWDGW